MERHRISMLRRLQLLPRVIWYFMRGYEIAYRVTIVGGSMISMGTKSLHIEVTAIGEPDHA